jgi:hypothetical protein
MFIIAAIVVPFMFFVLLLFVGALTESRAQGKANAIADRMVRAGAAFSEIENEVAIATGTGLWSKTRTSKAIKLARTTINKEERRRRTP